jgi:hypothetical protein
MRLAAGLALLTMLALASPAGAAFMHYTGDMDDAQEVAPGVPGTTTGTASVDLQLHDLGGGQFSLTMQILFTDHFNFMNVGGANNGGTEIVSNLHIHNQVRGVSGGVVWGIIGPDNDTDNDTVLVNNGDGTTLITTEWDMLEGSGLGNFLTIAGAQLGLLEALAGEDVALYLNLHTTEASGGAIRGQIVKVPEPFAALLLALGLGALARHRPAA